MKSRDEIIVFYDGKCEICIKTKSLVQRLDGKRLIKFSDLWTVRRLSGICREDLLKEVHLRIGDGEFLKGYFAIKYIILQLPLPLLQPLKWLFKLSVTDKLGASIYKVISRNRIRFTVCKSCVN